MKTEETKTVTFPCTDGSAVTVPEMVAAELEAFDVKRVRVVKSNGTRYFYIKTDYFIFDAHDMPEDVPLWRFVAYSAKLFDVLPGLGQIEHDGSDSFLLENFSREAEPKTLEPVTKPRPVKSYTPKISAELITKQLAWFAEPSLHLEAVKWAAVHTNPRVGEEVLQQTSIKLLEQIRGGQCLAQTAEQFHNYVLTAVGRKARRSRAGLNRSEVIPDLLSRKDLTEAMTSENYYEGMDRGVRRTERTKSLSGYDNIPNNS
ncbi:MAG TPA: hypothetical protein VG075_11130 [Candidatus Acidoferrum sp.]|jgi:hypothetical protein|nr:hypothetical protein [Candidatus Acidoferrum sp.]